MAGVEDGALKRDGGGGREVLGVGAGALGMREAVSGGVAWLAASIDGEAVIRLDGEGETVARKSLITGSLP